MRSRLRTFKEKILSEAITKKKNRSANGFSKKKTVEIRRRDAGTMYSDQIDLRSLYGFSELPGIYPRVRL